jgi:hypothetical protein
MRVWLGAMYVRGAVSGGAIGSIADPTLPSVNPAKAETTHIGLRFSKYQLVRS